jgi:predicted transcriptional regulator
MTIVKSSGVICKGNVGENYEKLPVSLFNYVELGLITQNELVVYLRLYQFYNEDYGYAFPTIEQLIIMTNLGKTTVHNCLDNLEKVGLIKKAKSTKFPNKNIYIVFKPLEREELYNYVPDKVQQLEEKKIKLGLQAEQDKARLQQYQQSKQEIEQREIEARQIVPKVEPVSEPNEIDNPNLLPEEIEMLRKLKLLPK